MYNMGNMNKIAVTSFSRIYQIYIRDEADESVFAEIFKEHEYRIADELIKNSKNPIVDAGAHSGLFSLYARSINPEVKIIAIEPEDKNLEYLRKHIYENQISNIEIIEEALASKSGRRHLQISSDSHNHKLLSLDAKTSEKEKQVNAISLSDLLKKCIIKDVGLLKMDIEGGEHEFFESLTGEELKHIEGIIIEYHVHYEQIEHKLRENGFGVQVFPSRFDKKMGFLFALNKRFKYGS